MQKVHNEVKPLLLDKAKTFSMRWFSFLRKDIPEEWFLSIPSLKKHKIEIKKDEMQYNDIFITVLLMKISMFLRNLLYFHDKEWNFYFKKLRY